MSRITKKRWTELVGMKTFTESEVQEILNFLKTLPKFSKQASKSQATVTVKYYKNARGFNHRTIMLNGFIPVSKSSVFPTTKTTKTQVLEAARNSINQQILDYRSTLKFPIKCCLTGEVLLGFSQVAIDHSKPLKLLCQDFLKEKGITWKEVKLSGKKNFKLWKDPKLRLDWYNYHLENAILQPVSKIANLKKGAKWFI